MIFKLYKRGKSCAISLQIESSIIPSSHPPPNAQILHPSRGGGAKVLYHYVIGKK